LATLPKTKDPRHGRALHSAQGYGGALSRPEALQHGGLFLDLVAAKVWREAKLPASSERTASMGRQDHMRLFPGNAPGGL